MTTVNLKHMNCTRCDSEAEVLRPCDKCGAMVCQGCLVVVGEWRLCVSCARRNECRR